MSAAAQCFIRRALVGTYRPALATVPEPVAATVITMVSTLLIQDGPRFARLRRQACWWPTIGLGRRQRYRSVNRHFRWQAFLIYQELNGKASSGADILVHTGQHIKQGQAIAKLGPNGTHVHIGASTQGLWSHGGGSTRGWLDVTKLTGNYGNSSKGKASVKAKGAMQKTIKSEVGGMFSWIKSIWPHWLTRPAVLRATQGAPACNGGSRTSSRP